jgi:hypothetical protein
MTARPPQLALSSSPEETNKHLNFSLGHPLVARAAMTERIFSELSRTVSET